MEEAYQPRRKRYAASYFKSRAVLFGALSSLFALALQLIQLFEEASKRSAANQAPPEAFTASGITWRALFIAMMLLTCILLARFRNGKTRMGRGRFCVLLGFLLVVFGAIRFVSIFLEILVYPEFINILDCLAVGASVLAPVIILELADLNGVPPDDTVLLFLALGGIGFSIISTLIISIVLRESYTMWRLVPELLLRAGLILFGVGALLKALALRAAYPLSAPVEPEAPKRRSRAREEDAFSLRLDEELRETQRDYTARTPRPEVGYDDERRYTVRTARPAEPYGGADGASEQRPRRAPDAKAANDPVNRPAVNYPGGYSNEALWQTGRIIVQGGTGRIPTRDPGTVPSQRQTCPYCGKRMPLGFPNCPRCGRDM